MKFSVVVIALFAVFTQSACSVSSSQSSDTQRVTIASFNVSMEARNYASQSDTQPLSLQGPQLLMKNLATGEHPQIKNIAEIIQRTRPDIILLNEFDYIENPNLGVNAFIRNYLNVSQNGSEPIDYQYLFYAPSNTGLPTTFDLNNDGKHEKFGADAQGFGLYSGHYGMVLLSKYPIEKQRVRTFQRFLWSDMPDALSPVLPESGAPFYTEREWLNLRLSSKSHWDIPVNIDGEMIHILASHPTPPVFDGDEDRNGKRNHDEIRFWLDYISTNSANYIYDDHGIYGGIEQNERFVILGDQNASPDRINDTKSVISELLASPLVNASFIPASEAGAKNKPSNEYAQFHTASWGARADYVIPSQHFTIIDGAVFWPTKNSELYRLVDNRSSSSDHRLVWLTLKF